MSNHSTICIRSFHMLRIVSPCPLTSNGVTYRCGRAAFSAYLLLCGHVRLGTAVEAGDELRGCVSVQPSDQVTFSLDTAALPAVRLTNRLWTLAAEGVADGTPGGAADGTPEGVADGTPEGAADGTPEGVADGTSEGAADGGEKSADGAADPGSKPAEGAADTGSKPAEGAGRLRR
ncbi:hypothetical protein FJT64_020099 [Amphibalanus amphitrite]|uniref:Uncharacterized protein n=1 Tax=Amphibalanus amphitrite TaxID=1232801 RepID=A0A6A4WTX7_AMPAM|nr:hypothetical protein FJT64_020099 [Amphibalanus amphitrite]